MQDSNNDIQKVNYVFQPIVNAKENTIFGYEALMRPENKKAEDFIEEYLRCGRNKELEAITIFNSIRCFSERGLDGKLFLNSLPSVCLDLDQIKSYAKEYGVSLENIVFEILEYGIINQEAMEKKQLLRTKEGIILALDDFGSGNNTTGKIEVVNPGIVKMDAWYLQDISISNFKKNTLEIVIEYLKMKDVTILAEGVETEYQRDFLLCKGVWLQQGYLHGKPE